MNDAPNPTPENAAGASGGDRWGQRFRIDGDPLEALKAILTQSSQEKTDAGAD